VAAGGTFVLVQLTLAMVFSGRLTAPQYLGMAAIVAGIVVVALHAPTAQT
jgi:hypothetical protein